MSVILLQGGTEGGTGPVIAEKVYGNLNGFFKVF